MSKPPPSYECDHCHDEHRGRPALELRAYGGLRDQEEWDLCQPCLIDLIAWIEGEEANGRTA